MLAALELLLVPSLLVLSLSTAVRKTVHFWTLLAVAYTGLPAEMADGGRDINNPSTLNTARLKQNTS